MQNTAKVVEQRRQQKLRLEEELQQQKTEWSSTALWVLCFLAIVGISFFTRLVRLEFPDQTVYDEVHFGGFAMMYGRGEYHFDVNPPLGKLIHHWACARFCERPYYPPTTFQGIGVPYPHDCYVVLRRATAIAGALLAPLTFLTVKAMGRSLSAAVLASGLVLLESSIVTQSRLILIDPFQWLFIALAAWGFAHLSQAVRERSGAAMRLVAWGAVAGLGLGGALAVKWPAVGVVLAFAVTFLWDNFASVRNALSDEEDEEEKEGGNNASVNKKENRKNKKEGKGEKRWGNIVPFGAAVMVMVAVALGVYYQSWVWHFEVLTKSGSGNEWHGRRFLASLEGSGETLLPGESPYSVTEKVVEGHTKLIGAWQQAQAPHDWGSTWWQWLFNMKPILYWVSETHQLWLSGNPAVFVVTGLLVLPEFLLFGLNLIHADRPPKPRESYYGRAGGWLLLGWVGHSLFYAFSRRVSFFYQYVPGHYCLMLLSAVILDKYITGPRLRRFVVFAILSLAAAYFCYNYAYTCGFAFYESF